MTWDAGVIGIAMLVFAAWYAVEALKLAAEMREEDTRGLPVDQTGGRRRSDSLTNRAMLLAAAGVTTLLDGWSRATWWWFPALFVGAAVVIYGVLALAARLDSRHGPR